MCIVITIGANLCVLPIFFNLKRESIFVLLEFPQITMQCEICGKLNEFNKIKRSDLATNNLSYEEYQYILKLLILHSQCEY